MNVEAFLVLWLHLMEGLLEGLHVLDAIEMERSLVRRGSCRGCGLVDAAKGDVGIYSKRRYLEDFLSLSLCLSLSFSEVEFYDDKHLLGNIGNSITTSQNF